ncbi:MAG: alpha/beta fold hydrolase [Oscillospiraceae bacterium]
MKFYEYGKENEKMIVMLHGANFVHSFGKQYPLAEKYHLIIPHIMGFGDDTDRVFDAQKCTDELAQFISGLGKKVLLVGFSLGAQLAFKLVSEHEELFTAAIIVSPWLIKEEPFLSKILEVNKKQFRSFKNKTVCSLIGLMNGLPKEQRKEFVEQMQQVKLETIVNSVDNGITLDSVHGFSDISIPVTALAGAKEQEVIHDSVKKMAQLNKNCSYEIWEKAAHNIPPLFAKRFNEVIEANV